MSSIKLQTTLVKPHFALTLKQEQKNLVDYIMDLLKGLEIASLVLDPDFLKYLSELIENQVCKKSGDLTPNKMDILVEIVKRLFPNVTTIEIDASKQIVEFLLKNGLIKKIALKKIMCFYLKKKFITG
jgi:hypothetical protein